MHLNEPRIAPLSDAELTPAQREALAPASYPGTPPLNIFRTLAHEMVAPLGDTHPAYPCFRAHKALKSNAPTKINPTGLRRAYTGLALTREDFEVHRTFEM
jgi:hypothetical protein